MTADRAEDPEVAMILASYAAFARGDIEQAVAPLAADVDWVEPAELPGGGHYRGPAAVAGYLRASRAGWAELESFPEATRVGDDVVVVHRVRGRLVDGTEQAATVADLYTVQAGTVVSMTAYLDPAAAFAAAGSPR